MLNAEVNNWGVQIKNYNIKFKFIKGVNKPLLTLSLG